MQEESSGQSWEEAHVMSTGAGSCGAPQKSSRSSPGFDTASTQAVPTGGTQCKHASRPASQTASPHTASPVPEEEPSPIEPSPIVVVMLVTPSPVL